MSAEYLALSDLLAFPVELPLTVVYDMESGELTLEAVILRQGVAPVVVRLDLSAEVAEGFIQSLLAVEDELGGMTARPRPARLLQ